MQRRRPRRAVRAAADAPPRRDLDRPRRVGPGRGGAARARQRAVPRPSTAAGTLVNEALRPGGWVVQETFELVPHGSTETRRAAHRQRPVPRASAPDGVLRAVAAADRDGTGFAVELVRDGVAEAVAAARGADVAVVVLGNHPLINGRETEDRVDLELPSAQDRLLRAVVRRPTRVPCSSSPAATRTRCDWAARARAGDPLVGARRSGVRRGRWPMSSRRRGTGRPAHPDLVPLRRRTARPARLRHHRQRRDLPLPPGHPALPVRARPDLLPRRVRQPAPVGRRAIGR